MAEISFNLCRRRLRVKFFRVNKLAKQLNKFLRKKPALGKNVLHRQKRHRHRRRDAPARIRACGMARCCAATSTASSSAITRTFRTLPCCTWRMIFRASSATGSPSATARSSTPAQSAAKALVGMGAMILDGAVIGWNNPSSGAKALVTGEQKSRPARWYNQRAPAKVVRALTKEERAGLKWWAEKYVDNGAYCRKTQNRRAKRRSH